MLFQLVSFLASQYVDNIKNEKQQCQGVSLKKEPDGTNRKIWFACKKEKRKLLSA